MSSQNVPVLHLIRLRISMPFKVPYVKTFLIVQLASCTSVHQLVTPEVQETAVQTTRCYCCRDLHIIGCYWVNTFVSLKFESHIFLPLATERN